jgi:hypothetical protein
VQLADMILAQCQKVSAQVSFPSVALCIALFPSLTCVLLLVVTLYLYPLLTRLEIGTLL